MSSDFRAGDEVVCINNQPLASNGPICCAYLNRLTVGDTYVIGEVRPATLQRLQIVVGLKGILAPTGILYGYDPARFRKVQKKFTGMTVLHAMLLKQPTTPELVH